jgi:glutathione peroxidase-family protein
MTAGKKTIKASAKAGSPKAASPKAASASPKAAKAASSSPKASAKASKSPTTTPKAAKSKSPAATAEVQKAASPAKKAISSLAKLTAPTVSSTIKAKKADAQGAAVLRAENVKMTAKSVDAKASAGKKKAAASKTIAPSATSKPTTAKSIHEFTVSKNGEAFDLSTLKGRPVFIMNVASACGKTEAGYKTLVDLHNMYEKKGKGLAVLAFPCNQFGAQEPGTYAEVCSFAARKGAKFPIFDKVDVNGDTASPLFDFLINATNMKRVEWNFVGFLCDKDGAVVQRFKSGPSFEAIVKAAEPYLLK